MSPNKRVINESLLLFSQDSRGLNQLMSKHGSNTAQELDDKSLTICSGLDMVNINYLHVVCESAEQAKVSIISLSFLLSRAGFLSLFPLAGCAERFC
jgi:phosphatidylinositol phospholipase C beta